jgi:hypothetical protein
LLLVGCFYLRWLKLNEIYVTFATEKPDGSESIGQDSVLTLLFHVLLCPQVLPEIVTG